MRAVDVVKLAMQAFAGAATIEALEANIEAVGFVLNG